MKRSVMRELLAGEDPGFRGACHRAGHFGPDPLAPSGLRNRYRDVPCRTCIRPHSRRAANTGRAPTRIASHRLKRVYTRLDALCTPEAKMPGWLDPSATRVRLKEAQEEEARARETAALEEFECALLELRWLVKSLRTDLLLRDFRHKYSPSQPRVQAGNPEGGQWTSGRTSSDRSDMSPGADDSVRTNESLAQDRLPRTPASDQPARSDRQQLESIANDPLIRAYMDEAWLASNPYGIFPKEHGFWISRDDASIRNLGR
jgi:hypothetical protein